MIEIFGMDLISFIIIYNISMFTGIIAFIIFNKWRNRGKLDVEVLMTNKKYKNKKYKKTEDNKVKVGKDTFNFEPLDFFEEEKPTIKFWRLPKRKLLWIEGTQKALSFKKNEDAISELQWWWSRKEIEEYIRKEIAKAKMDVKPISRMEFILILIFLVIIVVFNIILMNRLKVF